MITVMTVDKAACQIVNQTTPSVFGSTSLANQLPDSPSKET
ncbi:unannotated protein [freshwater metagenome]|uniref:Unannotated protein n=1 Tax=freshwater metagenome TaxID=449393 RepID=A0A6J6DPV0_9ZZZZ